MKKQFLTLALLATVAVGGATAIPVYDSTGNKLGDCVIDPILPDCDTFAFYDSEGEEIPQGELQGLDFVVNP